MLDQTLLREAYQVLEGFERGKKEVIERYIKEGVIKKSSGNAQVAMATIILELEERIRTSNNRARGLTGYQTLANKIFRTTERDHFKGTVNTKHGQMITDGYRVIIFPEPIDYPEADAETEVYDRIYTTTKENSTKRIDCPTLGEVKSTIDLRRAQADYSRGETIQFHIEDGDETIYANANFLLDILRSMEEPELFIREGRPLEPLFLRDKKGLEAVLLPMRKQ